MSLHMFYKKKQGNDSEQHKFTKVDLNSLPVDPGERKPMDSYHVNQRDEIRRSYLEKGPFQPKDHIFPARDFGGKPRRFKEYWFVNNEYWLEYSIQKDAAFCLCCYLFKSSIPNQGGSDHFVKLGFKAWNRKLGIDTHKAGIPHNLAVQMCQSLMNQRQSITSAFEKQTTLKEQEQRIRLIASIDCVRFLLHQGLAFRGHNEKEDSHNRGNFLELLQWLADRCEVVNRVVLKNAPNNAQMKCGDIQKDTVTDALAEGELKSGTGLNQEVGIKRPSDTRWGSHFASLLNIKSIYDSLCGVLKDVSLDSSDRDRRAEALRILKSIKSFDFIFCLHLMVHILGVTDNLNSTLQRKDQDIVNAMNQVSSSKKAIQEIRDVGWDRLLENVKLFCDKNEVEVVDMEDAYYDGFSRRRGSHVDNLHHYKKDVFYEVIDMQLQELNRRFNESNTILLICIACLSPNDSFKAFDLGKLMEMATLYRTEFPTKHDFDVLEVELRNYIRDVREDERFTHLKSIVDLAKKMVEVKKHIIYPKVYLLLKLALILPVATASVERAFSAMKLVKTDIRNKMGDKFLSDSLVSYIEKNVLENFDNDAIIAKFQAMKARRIQL